MDRNELANAIAEGIISTCVEGPLNAVSCSTAGDYPSIGCSQWEGPRADDLLSRIPGGNHYAGRSYSDIQAAGELDALGELISSAAGEQVQREKLAEDTADYVDALQQVPDLDDTRCTIYAGIWCPTSASTVCAFLTNRQAQGKDLRSLETLRDLFKTEYAAAAGIPEYQEAYGNRADTTYYYVGGLEV